MNPFTPGATQSVSVTDTTGATAINTLKAGQVRIVSMPGSDTAYIAFGLATLEATTASIPVPPGAVVYFGVPQQASFIAAICATGETATLKLTFGDGEGSEAGSGSASITGTVTVEGDVGITSFPAGNLGQQAMAASLSVVPASDITDPTYIGDIKFGESLPAGTNAIGTLAANTGVTIGAVEIAAAQTLATVTTVGAVTAITNALPAGTNNIGDVDVLTLPSQIAGPGAPVIDSYGSVAVNLAANTANQLLVSSAASKQIWVYGLVGISNVAGSISLQDEDDTALSGVMPVGITGGFAINPSGNFAMPWLKLATDKDLEADTVTCEFDGILTYAIVSV